MIGEFDDDAEFDPVSGGFRTPEQTAKAWFSRDPEFKARGTKQLIALLTQERSRAIEDCAKAAERVSEAMDPAAKCSLRQWNAIKSNNRKIVRAIRALAVPGLRGE